MSAVYNIVTDRIMTALKKGVVPWRQPWKSGVWAGSGPMSLSTGKAYRGANRFLLDPRIYGYSSPWWGTYREMTARGGHVRKGEKSSPCLFWSLLSAKDKKTGKDKRIPFLRYYSVFNLDQTEGVAAPVPSEGREFVPLDECERVVSAMPQAPSISHDGGGHCYYCPSTDSIHMTERKAFTSEAGYYATLFHELTHSTGHKRRLGRVESWGSFGSKNYAREEMAAELGSAFLCAEMAIDTADIRENESAYIACWLKRLEDDNKLVVVAAGAAQKAADFILGRLVEEKEDETAEVATV